MRKRISLATFRRVAAAEEAMIRATMPRTSAADSDVVLSYGKPSRAEVLAKRAGTRLVRVVAAPLTYTLADVRGSRGERVYDMEVANG